MWYLMAFLIRHIALLYRVSAHNVGREEIHGSKIWQVLITRHSVVMLLIYHNSSEEFHNSFHRLIFFRERCWSRFDNYKQMLHWLECRRSMTSIGQSDRLTILKSLDHRPSDVLSVILLIDYQAEMEYINDIYAFSYSLLSYNIAEAIILILRFSLISNKSRK